MPLLYLASKEFLGAIKLVSSVHGADFFPDGRPLSRCPPELRLLLHASDLIVAPSHGHLRDFLGMFPRLAPKAVFVHNSLAVQDFDDGVATEPLETSQRYLLCVAQLSAKKAVDVLIQAFANLAGDYPTLDLVLAGDGPLRESLQCLANDLGLGVRVRFMGHCPKRQVRTLLHACEVFVLASRAEHIDRDLARQADIQGQGEARQQAIENIQMDGLEAARPVGRETSNCLTARKRSIRV